jgi:acyl transferase domain-containing protein
MFVLSARDDNALAEARGRLAAHVETHAEQSLGDIAFTLQTGRRGFARRFAAVAKDRRGLIEELDGPGKAETAAATPQKLAFLFPGQGAQYPGMGQGLYRHYPVVARTIDQCASILEPLLGLDLRKVLFGDPREAAPRLQSTALAQPALFSVSFSVAALWRSLGFEPAAMLGHSIGEFVAATLAGVMRLEDALAVVAARGAMMQELPEGAMLAVMLAEPKLIIKACLPLHLGAGPWPRPRYAGLDRPSHRLRWLVDEYPFGRTWGALFARTCSIRRPSRAGSAITGRCSKPSPAIWTRRPCGCES